MAEAEPHRAGKGENLAFLSRAPFLVRHVLRFERYRMAAIRAAPVGMGTLYGDADDDGAD